MFMSALAVIDSLEFARSGQTLRGGIAVANLGRMHEDLHDTAGRIDYTVAGGHDARGRPVLRLAVKGMLHLRCQRCLGQLDYPVDIANTLLLDASGGSPEQDDPDEPESIEPGSALDVASLVEDEVLLGLPFAPRHAEGACGGSDGDPAKDTGAASPFSALAALKENARSKR